MEHIQLSGSEVMGLMASSYRLTPNADSLKTLLPDRLRHSFLSIWTYYNMSARKSQMFSLQKRNDFSEGYCAMWQILLFPWLGVDKTKVLCLNTIHKSKALTENLSFSDTAESRRMVQAGVDGMDDLLPEPVLPKTVE